ncbi:hypothetical protein L211DRAFT_836521 [Terfezia boudieri ATCC MYA-4762]|uniref:SWIM-type domain-containing protein n=1 Tax=Terfezia boudieri ATCC MYA-4762 TaxID=1051890 RepID=A0A3N4LQK2_9PEZI|nr:hypothetical protein L211DRAFT_836521 [Terfezia boudieri ATCC MYA-4762]
MPISADALRHRAMLFDLTEPVTMSPEVFGEAWPYVDSVYTKLQSELLQAYGTVRVQKYECRLRKSKKSGTARDATDGKVIKRRNSSIRDPHLCHVRIKVSRLVDGTAVIVERLDAHTHTHDIEESFRIKKPSILVNYITAEVVKHSSASQIFHALRGSERLEAIGGSSLTRHDIGNLKRGTKTANRQSRSLSHEPLFGEDIHQARSLLTERGWLFEELQVVDSKKEQRWGLVFANPTRLLTLQRRGWFTQFDATHKLNRWSHNMFSFLVRDEHNVWIPTAHMVVERGNEETIVEGLRHIKQWCSGKWQPRYIMTGDSPTEQRAIPIAFPNLNSGEQEVDHLLCSVYSNQTLLRRFGFTAHKPVYRLLTHAMYCSTEIQNRELCEQAIAAAVDQGTAKYIRTHWLQTASKWAMYARQHSPFLLQVTTTNACETWNRKLKSGAGLSKGQVASHGIYGMILNIMDAVNVIDNHAAVARSHFRNRKLPICTKEYPEIGQLPVPIQKLLSGELDAVTERIAKGKEVPIGLDENLQCSCKFYRQYLLPCRHIFHLDTEVKVLTTARWEGYVMMFAECGMAVYEAICTGWVGLGASGRANRANSLALRVRERMERLQQKVYAVQETMNQMGVEETTQIARLEEWVGHVEETLNVLERVPNRDLASRHRPWEL